MHPAYQNEFCPHCKVVQPTKPDIWTRRLGWHRKCAVCGTRVTAERGFLTAKGGTAAILAHFQAPQFGHARI